MSEENRRLIEVFGNPLIYEKILQYLEPVDYEDFVEILGVREQLQERIYRKLLNGKKLTDSENYLVKEYIEKQSEENSH